MSPMRDKKTVRYLDGPAFPSLMHNLAQWWIESEGVLAARDVIDHRADAARTRYTKSAFEARHPTSVPADRGERRVADECFAVFAEWASTHAARQLVGYLRAGLARSAEPLPVGRVQPRVEREITEAVRAQLSPAKGPRGPAAEKFDGKGDLDHVIEMGRANNAANMGN